MQKKHLQVSNFIYQTNFSVQTWLALKSELLCTVRAEHFTIACPFCHPSNSIKENERFGK